MRPTFLWIGFLLAEQQTLGNKYFGTKNKAKSNERNQGRRHDIVEDATLLDMKHVRMPAQRVVSTST